MFVIFFILMKIGDRYSANVLSIKLAPATILEVNTYQQTCTSRGTKVYAAIMTMPSNTLFAVINNAVLMISIPPMINSPNPMMPSNSGKLTKPAAKSTYINSDVNVQHPPVNRNPNSNGVMRSCFLLIGKAIIWSALLLLCTKENNSTGKTKVMATLMNIPMIREVVYAMALMPSTPSMKGIAQSSVYITAKNSSANFLDVKRYFR